MTGKHHCSSARHYLPLCWLFTATISGPKLSNRQEKITPIVRWQSAPGAGWKLKGPSSAWCACDLRSNADQVFQENTSKKHPSMLRPIKQITQGKEKQYSCLKWALIIGVSCVQTPLPSGKILRGGRSVHRLSWELRKIRPPSSEKFASVVSLIFLFKPKRSCGITDSWLVRLKAKHNSFFSPSVTLFDLFGVILV